MKILIGYPVRLRRGRSFFVFSGGSTVELHSILMASLAGIAALAVMFYFLSGKNSD